MSWRPIPGFPGYEICKTGRVRRAADRRPIRPGARSDSGYLRVRLGGRKVRVHRLVLITFVGPPPSPRHHGAHKNGNKDHNALRNLTWKLPTENEADKRRHGTAPRGGRAVRPSDRVVDHIRRLAAQGDSIASIARRHGVHRSTVSRYVRGLRRAKTGGG